ncbi:MAG: glycosyltransferase [Thermodesulfobacteriota bacterium]
MNVSLVVTTYNWPEALEMTLRSVMAQSRMPDEVVVADDGSGPETSRTVERVLARGKTRWCHVRHDDQGARQSRIKNLAVSHAKGSYLIFVDHDVVLHPHFVHDHISMARKGAFLQGKRLLLSRESTERILAKGTFLAPGPWMRGLGNRKNAFHLPRIGALLSRTKPFEVTLRGCNLSMFREDFLMVDGFDEVFDGSWGREDSDICYRLFHSGVQVRILWFLAIQYHLYHGRLSDWDRERLDSELKRNLEEKRIRAVRGYSTLSGEGGVIARSGACGD